MGSSWSPRTRLASGEIPYYGGNVGSLSEMDNLQAALRPVVLTERLVREGVGAVARPGGVGAGRTGHLEDHRREAHRGIGRILLLPRCMS